MKDLLAENLAIQQQNECINRGAVKFENRRVVHRLDPGTLSQGYGRDLLVHALNHAVTTGTHVAARVIGDLVESATCNDWYRLRKVESKQTVVRKHMRHSHFVVVALLVVGGKPAVQ